MLEEVLEDRTITLRPTTAFVSLEALRGNLAAIRQRVGPGVRTMAVVKANAYGHGLIRTALELVRAGADELGVAFVEEGIALRRAGITTPILVLGGIIGGQIAHYLEHDLAITAASPFKLRQIEEVAAAMKRRAKVHLKLDTGMERIGIHWDHASALFEAASEARWSDVLGVFSHFSTSDEADLTHTKLQLERFLEALDWYRRTSVPMPARHIANSGGILQHPESFFEMVRPGALLYGFYPSHETDRTAVAVFPALSLVTRVVYFKVVRAKDPVGYGRKFRPDRPTRVVTLPVGYGDGYSRSLGDKAFVLVGGLRYPVIGSVTMDAIMVAIGDGTAYVGDEAVLIGRQGREEVGVEELADLVGTIPYEILTSIGARVPRIYLEPGEDRAKYLAE
ncbi:MAG: alanine racemase [Deltaproteobacteria bacterium]|nr:alanine racemase [Deltaproteobacteria bacterium]